MEKLKYTVTKKDLEITFFSGSGAGGQHRNKHANCVRIKHPETGVLVVGQNHREKEKNMKDALASLANHPKFKFFCEQKLKELEGGETALMATERAMHHDNLEIYLADENGNMVSEKTGETLDPLAIKQAEG